MKNKAFTDYDIKKFDLILLVVFPILATFISWTFETNLLISTLLFFGVPAVYLSIRTPNSVLKSLLFSCLVVFTFGLTVDYLGAINNVWLTTDSISTFRLFGVLPLENPLWAFLYAYSVIIFYEHFLQKGTHKYKNKNLVYLVMLLVLFILTFFVVSLARISLVTSIPYLYLTFGISFFLIPLVIFLARFPKFVSKFATVASYFIFISLLNELTALKLNHWTFPGNQVIGWVEILNLRFPLEEFFFFIIIGSLVIIAYYEYFFDDRR